MAWIEKREGKNGVAYHISVSCGIDGRGKQLMRRMSWRPPQNMSPKRIEKELNCVAVDFERSVEQGYSLDQKQNFAEYAAYVIDLKERTGVRPRTIDRYKDLLVRINKAIGHMKLSDIRPQHLNAFYKNLGEQGIRGSSERGQCQIDLNDWLKTHQLSKAEISRRSGVSPSTMTATTQGKSISREKAEAIAAAMEKPVADVFNFTRDMTPLSSKTILEYHRLISTIMSQAEKEMLIPYNPAAKATPPKVSKKEPDYYQPEVMDRILAALDNAPLKWRTITYLLIDSGCRRGEAAGLAWKSVNLDEGIITIERALLYSAKRGVYEGPPKNGRSRAIKLAPETIELLILPSHKK